jgi:hypothetical protein
VSNNTEKLDCAIEPVARYTSPFTREALHSVYEVNDLFLGWLSRSSDPNEFESMIQKQLASMSAGSLRLAAKCPFFWSMPSSRTHAHGGSS